MPDLIVNQQALSGPGRQYHFALVGFGGEYAIGWHHSAQWRGQPFAV